MIGRSAVVGVALVLGTIAQAQPAGNSARPAPRPEVPQTLRILNQRLPEVSFDQTALEQVIAWLADFTKLNVSVRWQILADAGVNRDTPISIQARGLRLSQVLWLIMNEAGGSETKLAYRASGALLVLSTEDDLGKEMVTKIYDVSDLLLRVPRATRQAAFDVSQGMGQNQGGSGGGGGGGGGGGSGGMFGQGNQNNQNQNQNNPNDPYNAQGGPGSQIQQLVELIQQTVEPDTWRANGGLGAIYPFQRSIIVRNTILVHQKLGGYITENDLVGP
jgi:hypothetical protein